MKKRTAKKTSSHHKSQTSSSYYIAIVTLMLVLAFAGKRVYESASGAKVLGASVFLAEEGRPPDVGGGGNPPPQEPPKQESQPQNNPPPQQNNPQQNSAPPPQNQPPPQQTRRQEPEQRQQGQFQQPQQTRADQPQNPQRGDDRGNIQQRQTQQRNDQRNNENPRSEQNTGPQNRPSISTEQRQQFEQQFKEEATKNGFQFNGQLPERFQQFQQGQQSDQSGSPQGPSDQRGRSPQFQALPSTKEFPTISGKFEVRSGNNNTNINLNDTNTKIQLGMKNANFELKARKPDGTEVEIEKGALDKINTAMQIETGAQIEQKGEGVVLKRGNVTAQTALPLSFNLSTKTFTVQTSAGEKELNVLPDQAVEKLIKNKVITQVSENTVKDDSGVQLKEFKNKPVFEVKGTKQKKFLFFVPVTVSKTSLVSAETGDVVNTDQGLVSKVLETISF